MERNNDNELEGWEGHIACVFFFEAFVLFFVLMYKISSFDVLFFRGVIG